MEKKNKKTTTKKTKDEYKKGKAGVAARNAAAKKAAVRRTTKKTTEEEKEVKKVTKKVAEEKETKKVTKEVEKKETKKETKKEEPKKETKKVVTKKEEKPKKIDKKIEDEEDIDFLEKTIIFDGKDRDNLKNVVDKLEEETIVTKNRVVRRKPINKMIIYVLITLICITIVGTTVYVVKDLLEQRKNSQTLNSNIYDKVSKNYRDSELEVEEIEVEEQYKHFNTITLTKFERNVLDKKDMVVLISSQNCMGCLMFEPELEKALDKEDKEIYRLDITNWTETERTRLRTYYHFSSTPTLFVVKNGIVTKDSADVPSDINKLVEWTINNL